MRFNQALFLAGVFLLGWIAPARAQEEKATLILQSGEEIPCRILEISHGMVHFEAASTRLAFKYGEMIEIEKVASVRLGDGSGALSGRTLSMNEYLTLRHGAQPAEELKPPQPPVAEPLPPALPPTPAKPPMPPRAQPPSGPGLRVTSKTASAGLLDSARTQSKIGLRLPEPPPAPPSTAITYTELADLLAEAGLAGKLLYEMNAGVLAGRELTKSQKGLVDAISQSVVWSARKNDLRQAGRIAQGEFNLLAERQPRLFAEEFHFSPASSDHAFLEFVQFLHLENVLHFEDKWQKVETVFGERAASALRDILNNYEDWQYLFGLELEK
jgi:hypothetical protein